MNHEMLKSMLDKKDIQMCIKSIDWWLSKNKFPHLSKERDAMKKLLTNLTKVISDI